MDEDDDDENVWNASAVILDIDSGAPEDISSFFWISFCFLLNSHSQFGRFTFICHVNGVW